ncbi:MULTISPECIES: phosphonoacetaldehyde hydrolase [Alphaproteobacteria]|uniref:Phosphonoacetaldehyde hydrolase n=2 Tax=Alphaproteobacteria TaxID=28211 RepID=A0A512HH07_9HYPH|nr:MULTISPECIES: phosphonoacetaldehyde hydrolase [Alphaproteobacteria]GEO84722.1 phosphonoacetaldehyde hydrolase [Ciceribacter naphthalenivorans]GLR20657.1 phosphonoacetaldehyde hydrolase [Ciceribacter naphthalenivorans]GLT03513.1 phosphonoacetaldehyde hydrolase [Sphingomonas psychrolutea]
MTELQAVVFDWAGTLIDFGSCAPMGAFVEVFGRFGVEITVAEARAPMGRAKRDHIAAILAAPRISAAWVAAHGAAPTDADIDAIYEMFVPMNAEAAVHHADPIPGAPGVLAELRARGLKIGSTTGYTREIMQRILPLAEAAGLRADSLICAGDLPEGRPSPLGMFRTFIDLDIWPAWRVVKIDDTPVGIAEGVNAGCWTVGVTLSGNEAGLSEAELAALSPAERDALRNRAGRALSAEGAHFLVDSVADLLPVLDEIDRQLAAGAQP